MEADDGLRVLEMHAQNFMGVKVFALKLSEDGEIIAGDNGAGKSSACKIVEAALGGAKGSPAMPIRAGAFRAQIAVVLGRDGKTEYRVEKEWEQGEKPELRVTKADGGTVGSPQDVLNGFFEAISFDLGAFISPAGEKTDEGRAKKQVETLLRACPLDVDLDQLAGRRKLQYDARTLFKRDADRYAGELRPLSEQAVPDAVDLTERRAGLKTLRDFATKVAAARAKVEAMDFQIAEIRKRFEQSTAQRALLVGQIETAVKERGGVSSEQDITNIEADIAAAEKTNIERERVVAANAKFNELLGKLKGARNSADEAVSAIKAIDQQKIDALARARFPVAGLGIDETLGVTLAEGGSTLPYSQLNLAKRAEIAVKILSALHPKLRFARIDGNVFDKKTLGLVWRAARTMGLQLLIERWATDVPASVVMEDGEIAGRVPETAGGVA